MSKLPAIQPSGTCIAAAADSRPAPATEMAGNDEGRSGTPGGPAASVITKVKPKAKRPNLYRVLILNDDYTPMEFVVHVLEKFFQKDVGADTKIMLHVHHHGIGECGVHAAAGFFHALFEPVLDGRAQAP